MDASVLTVVVEARKRAKLTQENVAAQLGVSRRTYIRFEAGETALHIEQLRRLAGIIGISPGTLGLADAQPFVAGDDLLRMMWALFHTGRSDLLRPQLPALLEYLQQNYVTGTRTPLMTQGYQVCVALLRDQGRLDAAQEAADRAVVIAQDYAGIDDHATALFTRSRIPIDALPYATNQATVDSWLTQARTDAEAAAALADHCRPIVRAIILMNVADVRARCDVDPVSVQASLTTALRLAGNYPGVDELGYVLIPAGVLHIRARTGWYNALPTSDALSDIQSALSLVRQTGGQARWMLDMQITRAGLYAAAGRSSVATEVLTPLIDQVRGGQAARLISRLRLVIEQLDDPQERMNLLIALNRST